MITLETEAGPPGEPYRFWYVCSITVKPTRDGHKHFSFTPSSRIDEDWYHLLVRAENSLRQLVEHTSLAVVERNFAELVRARPEGAERGGSDLNLAHLRFEVGVKFLNWLSSGRLFLEHSKVAIIRNFGADSPELVAWDNYRRAAFDSSAAYRLAERLRDYVVHVGLPPITGKGHVDANERRLGFVLNPAHLLELWDGWKADVKRDLQESSEPIPLYRLVGEAMLELRDLEKVIYSYARPYVAECVALLVEAAEPLGGLPRERMGIVESVGEDDGRQYMNITEVSADTLHKQLQRYSDTRTVLERAGPGAIGFDVPPEEVDTAIRLRPGDWFKIGDKNYRLYSQEVSQTGNDPIQLRLVAVPSDSPGTGDSDHGSEPL